MRIRYILSTNIQTAFNGIDKNINSALNYKYTPQMIRYVYSIVRSYVIKFIEKESKISYND